MNNGIPFEELEARAAAQRVKIHQSVGELKELKTNVTENVKEKLDPKRLAREHFWAAVGVASLLGLVLGHGLAGVFVD
jgi:ElaB/YqjD/DUF883 family membrane-anchored ribosome-binding protein